MATADQIGKYVDYYYINSVRLSFGLVCDSRGSCTFRSELKTQFAMRFNSVTNFCSVRNSTRKQNRPVPATMCRPRDPFACQFVHKYREKPLFDINSIECFAKAFIRFQFRLPSAPLPHPSPFIPFYFDNLIWRWTSVYVTFSSSFFLSTMGFRLANEFIKWQRWFAVKWNRQIVIDDGRMGFGPFHFSNNLVLSFRCFRSNLIDVNLYFKQKQLETK